MSNCQVSGCPSKPEKYRGGPRIYFYTLGTIRKRNPNRFAEFLAVLKPRSIHCKPVENLVVCSVHFADDAYEPGELSRVAHSTVQNIGPPRAPRLKADALPTLHLCTEETTTRVCGCKYKKQAMAKTSVVVHPKHNERQKKRAETQTSAQINQNTEVVQTSENSKTDDDHLQLEYIADLPQVTPKNSTTKRKRVESPLFCHVDSNSLYPEELQGPKKSRFVGVCRICASHATEFNELKDIFDQNEKKLDFAAKINKFLPIDVHESDSLPHWICIYCADLLEKMVDLYFTCHKTDAYFNEQNKRASEEADLVEEYDDEDSKNMSTCNPDLSSPTCDLQTEIKIEDTSIVGLTAEDEESIKSEIPGDTNCFEKENSDSEIYAKDEIEPTTNNERKINQQSVADSSSASDNKGIEEPNDPDFTPEVVDDGKTMISTSFTPKKFPWKCDFCDTILSNRTSATSHYELEHKKYLCTNCFEHYQSQGELLKHHEEKCSGPTNNEQGKTKYRSWYPCKFCSNRFYNKTTLKEHVEDIHKKFICFKCLVTFDIQSEFQDHLQLENHGKICKICNIEFQFMNLWKKHVWQHHNFDNVKVVLPTETENLKTGVPVEINEFASPIQSKNTYTCKTLPVRCHFCCHTLTSLMEATDHYKLHEIHLCSLCFNHFETAKELGEHTEKLHTFSCALCEYKDVALDVNSLKNKHRTSVHTKIYSKRSKVYECGVCDKNYEEKIMLMNHMSEAHTRYICYVCLKCFNDEKSYTGHLEIANHYLKCKICDAQFARKEVFKRHQFVKHNTQEPRRSITCLVCSQVYYNLTLMKKHYCDVHDKLYCSPCNLIFNSHSDIDSHSLQVHGYNTSWSYQCSACKKYFESESNLAFHIKIIHENYNE